MGTTLIRASLGGAASDDDHRVSLLIPAAALAVDTTVTIVAEAISWSGPGRVIGSWRLVAHPAPAVLAQPARLSALVPAGTLTADLRLFLADDAAAPAHEWRPLVAAQSDRSLDAATWYLPPSHGPPPTQSAVLICLSGREPTARMTARATAPETG